MQDRFFAKLGFARKTVQYAALFHRWSAYVGVDSRLRQSGSAVDSIPDLQHSLDIADDRIDKWTQRYDLYIQVVPASYDWQMPELGCEACKEDIHMSDPYFIQSQFNGSVIQISDRKAEIGASLDTAPGFQFPSGRALGQTEEIEYAGWQLWEILYAETGLVLEEGAFFIQSLLDRNLVIDIQAGNFDPEQDRGPPLQLNSNNGARSQLWKLIAPPNSDSYFCFYQNLASPPGTSYVMDLRREEPSPGTTQLFRMKNTDIANQLWQPQPPLISISPNHIIGNPLLPGAVIYGGLGGRTQIIPGWGAPVIVGSPFGPSYPGGIGVGGNK